MASTSLVRAGKRKPGQLRPVTIKTGINIHAEGSALIGFGNTKVLCTASVEEKVPPFLKGTGKGWVTAEYGMLPRATNTRNQREAAKGKPGGRTMEIQRLIGRALRSVVRMELLGERSIWIDCDVLQADGGTRTAAITGGFVALCLALEKLRAEKKIAEIPVKAFLAAISVGIVNGVPVVDLDYQEDSSADTDMNVVMTGKGKIVEIQGTAEKDPFDRKTMDSLVDLAAGGIAQLVKHQKKALPVHFRLR